MQLLALMQATALKRTPLLEFSSGYIYEYIFHDFLSNQPFFVLQSVSLNLQSRVDQYLLNSQSYFNS